RLSVRDGLERPEQAKAGHRCAGIMRTMAETAVSPGRTIGRFRLEALIGEGATGLVFRARTEGGSIVAVKQLRPELVEDEAALARFRREALLARSITTPHLAPIVELGEVDGRVYLVQPYYEGGSLAPELIEGSEASRQSDIYALGCVVYECLVGEPPFDGRAPAEIGFAHLVEAPPDPRERRPRLPRGLADAVLAALEKEPAARPTTATALARLLHVGCSSSPA